MIVHDGGWFPVAGLLFNRLNACVLSAVTTALATCVNASGYWSVSVYSPALTSVTFVTRQVSCAPAPVPTTTNPPTATGSVTVLTVVAPALASVNSSVVLIVTLDVATCVYFNAAHSVSYSPALTLTDLSEITVSSVAGKPWSITNTVPSGISFNVSIFLSPTFASATSSVAVRTAVSESFDPSSARRNIGNVSR